MSIEYVIEYHAGTVLRIGERKRTKLKKKPKDLNPLKS